MEKSSPAKKPLGLPAVIAIGLGGMVGGGIFAVLGLAVQLGRGAAPISFTLAGLVALITSYSYARLSTTFPSQGGTVEFLNQAFGSGIFTGALNNLLLLSYVVMISLYAYAFGSYGSSFLPVSEQLVWRHIFMTAIIVFFAALNLLGSKLVGHLEEWIVGIKIAILVFFIAIGIFSVNISRLAPANWPNPVDLVAGGMIIFVAYEGFELIANAAKDVSDPTRTLPRAYFVSVGLVIAIYLLASAVTVGNLPFSKIIATQNYALATAAQAFLGVFGFTMIGIAALLSTSSAINATLYGTARVSYIIAKDGELPRFLEDKVWRQPAGGLLLVTGLALVIVNSFDIQSISTMGSAGFLLIFSVVNAANVRLFGKTGSRKWISILGFATCLIALAALLWQGSSISAIGPAVFIGMILASFLIEVTYRKLFGRSIHSSLKT